jgi:hypothetical protein
MTPLFEPTIELQRLLVQAGSRAAYDERFHGGVNVLRGENSSGKSTILNLVFYALGGDLTDWSDAALRCTRVFAEVSLNGKVATLSREISNERGRPMEVFGGPLNDALVAPRSEWLLYPYARSSSKESFSQALFRLLHLPEVAGEQSGKLTMHQLLRLLYSDQLSPVVDLFRYDGTFDSPVLRDTIGRLLCGAYDNRLYANEIRIRQLTTEYNGVSSELKALLSALGHSELGTTLQWIAAERSNLQQQRNALVHEIESATAEAASSSRYTLEEQQAAYKNLQEAQKRLASATTKRDALRLDIADSASFLAGLHRKLDALDDSKATVEAFGGLQFQICPSCYAPVTSPDGASGHCHLCKESLEGRDPSDRIVAIINDVAIQIRQSEALQARRTSTLAELEAELTLLTSEWRRVQAQLALVTPTPTTKRDARLSQLNQRVGYLQRQEEMLDDRERLAALVQEKSQRKAALDAEIQSLTRFNAAQIERQQSALDRAYRLIEKEVLDLLRHDLRRQDAFEDPKQIQFDFGANKISVDGQTYFSASSLVVLKTSFIVGFLAAATKDSDFKHPRFCLIDTIEDKGMEVQRSHNLQLQILRKSREAVAQHQVIFATSMIAPELDDEEFTVGGFSTRDNPTLKSVSVFD